MSDHQKQQEEEEPSLPNTLLTRLYDCCGSESVGTKGFILFYINEDGKPSVASKTDNMCVDMALHKLVEIFNTPNSKQKR